MLDKKQIQAIFLFEFKMCHKAVETTYNINTSGPGTDNECTVQWWFKKFCKQDKSLEDDEHCGWPSEVDNEQLRGSLKSILFRLRKKLPKNSLSTILWSFSIWSKLERWKSSRSGCLMSWPKVKKKSFWSVIFSHSMQWQWTINRTDCDMGQKLDFCMTIDNNLLSSWTKK